MHDPKTQRIFNDSIKINFILTFDPWKSDRKIIDIGLDCQSGFGSSSSINSPKCFSAAHQTEARAGPANKANNISVFDRVDIRKYLVKVDRTRYPKDADHKDLEYEKNFKQ